MTSVPTAATAPALSELQLAFRDVMAGVAAPVSVVSTLVDGRPHATTVSAWASLSMTPPMVLVSLDRTSQLLERLRTTGRFGVNVLASDQADLATRFAGKGDDKFAGTAWVTDGGVPRLPGAAGWLVADVTDLVPGGDHVVVLGTVVAAHPGDALPLSYAARRFGTHTPLP